MKCGRPEDARLAACRPELAVQRGDGEAVRPALGVGRVDLLLPADPAALATHGGEGVKRGASCTAVGWDAWEALGWCGPPNTALGESDPFPSWKW